MHGVQGISVAAFIRRFLAAFAFVALTWNPTRFCYFDWAFYSSTGTLQMKAFIGAVLVAIFAIYYQATKHSLGTPGVGIILILFGTAIWQFVDWNWLDPMGSVVMPWILLIILAAIMALGLSWSHIHRVLSGQIDVDISE